MGNRRSYKVECLHRLGTSESERIKVPALNFFHPTTSPPFQKVGFFHIVTQSQRERVNFGHSDIGSLGFGTLIDFWLSVE